ncbi:MAG: YeeE/YedE family protein [Deltaproteobacteria bacterium]|nr:MAG: YeeE/YedE family protein [Deltaproteobacteria bacterium]
MNNVLKQKSWSPYVAGSAAGILLCLSVLIAGKYMGASTTFVRSAGLIEKIFAYERVAKMDYFVKTKVRIDWQWMFVVGIFFGSLLASRISRDFVATAVPPTWEKRFGPEKVRRWTAAFTGGTIAMFGARLTGGCPSGHGLSGLSQLAVSGYISLICFFLAGIGMARILYGGTKGR